MSVLGSLHNTQLPDSWLISVLATSNVLLNNNSSKPWQGDKRLGWFTPGQLCGRHGSHVSAARLAVPPQPCVNPPYVNPSSRTGFIEAAFKAKAAI